MGGGRRWAGAVGRAISPRRAQLDSGNAARQKHRSLKPNGKSN